MVCNKLAMTLFLLFLREAIPKIDKIEKNIKIERYKHVMLIIVQSNIIAMGQHANRTVGDPQKNDIQYPGIV
jgi:hypothetical protein